MENESTLPGAPAQSAEAETACELWDWARTAGLSREELKQAIAKAAASADREET